MPLKDIENPLTKYDWFCYLVPGAILILCILFFEYFTYSIPEYSPSVKNNSKQAMITTLRQNMIDKIFGYNNRIIHQENTKQNVQVQITKDFAKHTPLYTLTKEVMMSSISKSDENVYNKLLVALLIPIVLLILSYTIGHIIATISSLLIDRLFIAKGYGYPYEKFLNANANLKINSQLEASRCFYRGLVFNSFLLLFLSYLLFICIQFRIHHIEYIKLILIEFSILLISLLCLKFYLGPRNDFTSHQSGETAIIPSEKPNNINKEERNKEKDKPKDSQNSKKTSVNQQAGKLFSIFIAICFVALIAGLHFIVFHYCLHVTLTEIKRSSKFQYWIAGITVILIIIIYLYQKIFSKDEDEKVKECQKEMGKKCRCIKWSCLLIRLMPFCYDKFIAIPLSGWISSRKSFESNFTKLYDKYFEEKFQLKREDANTDNFWFCYLYICSKNPVFANLIENWLRLYSFSRNLSMSFFVSFLYCFIWLVIHKAGIVFSIEINVFYLYLIPFVYFILFAIMVFRYYYLYAHYYSRFIFRAFVQMCLQDNENKKI